MSTMPIEMDVLLGLCERLENAQTIDASLDVLHETLHKLGWQKLVYGWKAVGTAADTIQVPVMTREFPVNWDRHWATHSPSDPYFQTAYSTQKPVFWSNVRKSVNTLPPKQVDCIHYIEDLGFVDGLTMPVCVSGRRFAFVTALDFAGSTDPTSKDVSDTQTELIKLIAHFFDNHMIGVSAADNAKGITLSPREKECLLWSAQGKTVDDIASIVGISTETARIYIKRFINKMNASNKTHAVAKAIHMGIVSIN